jgi:hypothetical protein
MPKIFYRNKKVSTRSYIFGIAWRSIMNMLGIGLVFLFLGLVWMILDTYIFNVVKLHFFMTEGYVLCAVSRFYLHLISRFLMLLEYGLVLI